MNRRGATILEVLVAAAILMIGLVGVVQLVLAGALAERRGEQAVSASRFASESLTEARATPFDELVEGTFDGGFVYDANGRPYFRDVSVVLTSALDGGYPTYDVSVRVAFVDRLMPGMETHRVTEMHTLLSRPPDAGL